MTLVCHLFVSQHHNHKEHLDPETSKQRSQPRLWEMSHLCSKDGCKSLGTKFCASCGDASYCSAVCQKEDWKIHKHSCVNPHKLPTEFLPVAKIAKLIHKVDERSHKLSSQGKMHEAINVMVKLLAFLTHQFGRQVEGKPYCIRFDGGEVDNLYLVSIRVSIANLYDMMGEHDERLKYLFEARKILEYRNKSEEKTINVLSEVENQLSRVYCDRRQWVEAERCCGQSLVFSRLLKGDEKVSRQYDALNMSAVINGLQGKIDTALSFSESAYILVSEEYGPVHPSVQDAANQLVNCLIEKGDYDRADNYCRMNLENLRDPHNGFDQKSSQVAESLMQIATIWCKKTPAADPKAAIAFAEEAEDFARKSCAITDTRYVSMSLRIGGFVDVLLKRGKYNEETRIFLVKLLAIYRQKAEVIPREHIHCLTSLTILHNRRVVGLPSGEARDREVKIVQGYMDDAKRLGMPWDESLVIGR